MFHVKQRDYDVVVIGGGHAGAEAAQAAYRMGVKVALITHCFEKIGEMSCNPAVGGVGKGHLVREIDALDGVMGRVADKAGIQFRLLNRSKGPAVWGPRTQADRKLYRQAMQREFSSRPDLHVIEAEVRDLVEAGGQIRGVVLGDGSEIGATCVVLTTGTFLRGVILVGGERRPGGRIGEKPAVPLAKRIEELALPLGRLKTGTPPRLDGNTINWTDLEMQQADENPTLLSFLHERPFARQIQCGITQTSEATHEIIEKNLTKSAIYGGYIDSKGPRYCPSIEDKVVRFSDKSSHQVFLEPESLSDNVVYPNGISTSLPADIQEEFVQTIKGLENVKVLQPGYAIEYDYVDPRSLKHTYEVKNLRFLFLAGQINGTTGYEEAAAQGLVAGLNAALAARNCDPIVLDRADGYLGVLTDDLVTHGVTEPYRMFTSRAEYRLSLRIDNADQRLTPIGCKIGCVSEVRKRAFSNKMDSVAQGKNYLNTLFLTPAEAKKIGLKVSQDGNKRSALDLMKHRDFTREKLTQIWPETSSLNSKAVDQLFIEAKYAGYVDRQKSDVELMRKERLLTIPSDIDYRAVSGLSAEIRAKLERTRPHSIGQAQQLEGMTPAAVTQILIHLKQLELRKVG